MSEKKFSIEEVQALINFQNERPLSKADITLIAQEVVNNMSAQWVSTTDCGKYRQKISQRMQRKFQVPLVVSILGFFLAAEAFGIKTYEIILTKMEGFIR